MIAAIVGSTGRQEIYFVRFLPSVYTDDKFSHTKDEDN